MQAYHISSRSSISNILLKGLRSGKASRYGHVGKGIYVIFYNDDNDAIEQSCSMADYLGIDDFILIKTNVDENDLLMDEDSLEQAYECVEDNIDSFTTNFSKEMLSEFLEEMQTTDDEIGGRVICLKLIDKYKIKPINGYTVCLGHYDFATARATNNVLPVLNVWVLNDNHELVEFNKI